MKKETIEEAAENYKINIIKSGRSHRVEYTQQIKLDFIAGAKWQQEQAKEMEKQEQVYNKEIVNILDNVRYWETCPDNYKVIIEKFIEQFKNK